MNLVSGNDYYEKVMETAAICNRANPIREGDFQKDGLWHCGKCKTPKQIEIKIGSETIFPMCVCKCEAERIAAEKEREKEAERKRLIERRRDNAFLGAEWKTATFKKANNENPENIKKARNFCDNFQTFLADGIGLLLWGDVGTGKTYVASCIVNDLLDRGYRCKMVTIAKLANTLTSMFGDKQEFIDSFAEYDLLVIDDLGAEAKTPFRAETIKALIDCREESGKPTIITTNYSMDEFISPSEVSLQRPFSRIMKMCVPIKFVGGDLRKKCAITNLDKYKKIL